MTPPALAARADWVSCMPLSAMRTRPSFGWTATWRSAGRPTPEAERIAASLRVTAMNSQAQALEAKGDLASAESLLRSAAALAEKALGPYHQDFAGVLNNLASLLESKGDTANAEAFYRRALAICEKALGPEDPHTAASLDNLAGLLAGKGDWAEAEPLYLRALAVAEKSLGPDHPTTHGIRDELNDLRPKQGR